MKMTSIVKTAFKALLILLLTISVDAALAQPGGGGPGGAGGPGGTGGPESIPIDGGIGAFLIAGAALGAKQLHSHYKKKKLG
jgi:hypothetical protein